MTLHCSSNLIAYLGCAVLGLIVPKGNTVLSVVEENVALVDWVCLCRFRLTFCPLQNRESGTPAAMKLYGMVAGLSALAGPSSIPASTITF
jgi:hypothetical protein